MTVDSRTTTRRKVLATTGSLAALGAAGCVGGDEPAGDPSDDSSDDVDGGGDGDGNGEATETVLTILAESVEGHDEDDEDDHADDENHEDDEDDHGHDEEDDNDSEDDHDEEDDNDSEDDHDEDDHDDEDEDDHDHEEDDHDDGEGLSDQDLEHSCGHIEYEEGDSLTAGPSEGDAPTFSETHKPYAVTVEDGEGYVAFEVGDHDHDEEEADEEHDHDDEPDAFAFFTDVADVVEVVEGDVEYHADDVESCDEIAAYQIVHLHDGRAVFRLTAED